MALAALSYLRLSPRQLGIVKVLDRRGDEGIAAVLLTVSCCPADDGRVNMFGEANTLHPHRKPRHLRPSLRQVLHIGRCGNRQYR